MATREGPIVAPPGLVHRLGRCALCTLGAGLLLVALLSLVSAQLRAAADEARTGPLVARHSEAVPQAAGNFAFAVTADIRSFAGSAYDSTDYHRGVIEAIERLGDIDFIVSPGDIDPPAGVLWTITRTLGVTYPWYPVVGNHDLPGDGAEDGFGSNLRWLQSYDYGHPRPGPAGCPTTTYSFDYGNAHLVMLNEYCASGGPDVTDGDMPDHVYDWLAADLSSTDKTHTFIFGHEPAYPLPDADNGRERHMTDSLNAHPAHRDRFWKLLREAGVVAYLCGHTHDYSATYIDGVWQIDVGHARGAGDPGAPSTLVVVRVDGDQVALDTYRDVHNGLYDYEDIVHSRTLAPMSVLAFQDGAFPSPAYTGTQDAYIDGGAPSTIYGVSDPLTLTVGSSPGRATVLRWDLSGIQPDRVVVTASIELHVKDVTSETYALYELKRDWAETEVTWDQRSVNVAWQQSGARGADDRGTAMLGEISAVRTGPYVVELNQDGVALVQRWLDDPTTNHGLIVADNGGLDVLSLHSREALTVEDRPKLLLSTFRSRSNAHLTVAGPATGTTEAGYVFTARAWPLDTSLPITFQWQASGQGVTTRAAAMRLRDSQAFTWTVGGPQLITVTASSDQGMVTDTHAVSILRLRQADFVAWPTRGIAPVTVTFTNTSNCSYTHSLWRFGDGVSSALSRPTHTYAAAGSYTVTLVVTGTQDVCTASKARHIVVRYPHNVYVPVIVRE